VLSQKHEGWQVLSAKYDDGGFSGGNMQRPGLKKLLGDIAAGKIDKHHQIGKCHSAGQDTKLNASAHPAPPCTPQSMEPNQNSVKFSVTNCK